MAKFTMDADAVNPALVPQRTLYTGAKMPAIGLGTFGSDHVSGEEIARAVYGAAKVGYRHFDCAAVYGNEHLIGPTLRQLIAEGLPREELWITSKLWNDKHAEEDVIPAFERSLHDLQLDYLDLYLIHWPHSGMNLAETFQSLNQLVRAGKVRWLGVSNFNLKLLKQAAALSESPLLTNQVPYSLPDQTYIRNGVLEYCQQNDILLTAYSPLKHRYVKGNKVMKNIAQSRGVSTQQIALAWLTTQPRVISIPTSFNPQHQAENFAAADLVLSDAEMTRLSIGKH